MTPEVIKMRIKEVEKTTGLTAKAIRLYESKGLLSVARESENDYRDYTPEDVERLKTIAVLRQLNVPVKTIKEWTDGKVTLGAMIDEVCQQSREESKEQTLRLQMAERLSKAIEKQPDRNVSELMQEVTELRVISEELDELMHKQRLANPVWTSFMALGPVGMTIFWILFGAQPDQLLIGFGMSILSVLYAAFSWRQYLSTPKSDRENDGVISMILVGVLTVASMILLMMGLTEIQYALYVSDVKMIVLARDPWMWLVLLVEAEIIGGYFAVRNRIWEKVRMTGRKLLAAVLVLLLLNGVVLYGFVTGTSVASDDGIIRYSFFDLDGEVYGYDDIVKVETGFGGKFLGLPMYNTGDFYYKVTYKDGTTEDWGGCTSDFDEDSWLWMIRLDEMVMAGGAEKISSEENYQYCQMDQRYVDMLLQVIRNQ